MRRAIAAVLIAAVIPLGAAKCSIGRSGGMPAKYQYTWMEEISPQQYNIVFQRDKPEGNWVQRGWVKGRNGIAVWVQRRQK